MLLVTLFVTGLPNVRPFIDGNLHAGLPNVRPFIDGNLHAAVST